MLALMISLATVLPARAASADRVKTANGIVKGAINKSTGVRAFKAIPFAQPPVGDLRWKAPQPVKDWTGVRPAMQFGARCEQLAVFGDMNFRSNGMSEDCLYLNVWTPAKSEAERLPVLVYFFGGGFVAGDGSEPRYDGESIAQKGIVALTVNYRLGLFGFFAHPELSKEAPYHASGNYALLDQNAALKWVQDNIAAFGGDPKRVTIAGESAGSLSVSVQMASPLSKDLIAGAIGESGAAIGPTLPAVALPEAEQIGVKFAAAVGANSLAALRGMSADQLLATKTEVGRFPIVVDGYLLPKPAADLFAAGEQAHVPLLVGWNSEEMNWRALLHNQPPTPENYADAIRKLYGDKTDEVLKLYPGQTDEQVIESATALASARFIGFSTWKWSDLCEKTGGKPVYRYFYAHPRPPMRPEMGNAAPGLAGGVVKGPDAKSKGVPPATGAVHSAEIEYAMGNLSTNKVYAWTADDYKVSKLMQNYFANFIKNGNPNGAGLPEWPAANAGDTVQVMHIDVDSKAEPEQHRDRYVFLDSQYAQK